MVVKEDVIYSTEHRPEVGERTSQGPWGKIPNHKRLGCHCKGSSTREKELALARSTDIFFSTVIQKEYLSPDTAILVHVMMNDLM